tara:strand:+ start:1204 stop:1440 length:237 start_codon:yes stop_codon:yes gene_type:complete
MKLIFHDKVINYLGKQDPTVREMLLKRITATTEKPFRYFRKMTGLDTYKMRVGPFRVIALIHERCNSRSKNWTSEEYL